MWFDLSVLAAKSAIVLIYLMILFRLLGKRQVAQFNLYDLATIIAVANAVQNAMTEGKGDLAVGFVCAGALLLVGWVITRTIVKVPKAEAFMFGTPTIILSDGKIFKDRMHREHVAHDELLLAMRQHGILKTDDVSLAVLEVDGSISIVPRRNAAKA